LPLQPDSALNQATEYFHKKKDLLNETKARYYAGLAERHVGNYQQAIWETLNAIDRAHEAADTFWMGRAHDLAYEIYMATYDCHNAAIEADKAAIYFKRAGAVPFHRYALLEKAQALNYPVYEDDTPIGRGMFLLDSLKNVALTDQDSALAVSCLYHQCIYNFENKDYEIAQTKIDSLLTFSQDSTILTHLLPYIISMQMAQGQYPRLLLKEYEATLGTQQDTMSYLQTKRKLAATNHNWESAFQLSDSLLTYYEILFADKTFRSVDEIKDNYNKAIIKNKQNENKRLKRSRTLIGCFTFGCILIAILFIILLRRRNKHKQQETMGKLLEIASENEALKIQTNVHEAIVAENETLRKTLQEKEDTLTEHKDLETKVRDYDRILSENTSLKEQLKIQEKILNNPAPQDSTGIFDLSLKRSSLIGNKIDTLCNMAMEYYGCEATQAHKNDIYNRILKELKQLKSEKFLKDFEHKVNDIHNSILDRLQKQLPEVAKGNLRWIAMFIGGLHPRTISFLLDMKIQTLYSKRLRVRSYIEKSDAPDKKEFLFFFPKPKE
ncbi:MAG: hypothetical protein K2H60_02980, partial [Muribaculaceae bacterium]|nr:hypothetical protein [Muribaculaceae bacterium]